MDEAHLTHASKPGPARTNVWTSRIILSALACVIGLWLGTGSHTAAAGAQATKQSAAAAQTAIADVFRFDILLAGKAQDVTPNRSKAGLEKQRALPAEVRLAMQQHPVPVTSDVPSTLSCPRPRFVTTPAASLRLRLDRNVARLQHTREGLLALLATLPDPSAAEIASLRIEATKDCNQIDSIRMESGNFDSHRSETPGAGSEVWPEPQAQFIP